MVFQNWEKNFFIEPVVKVNGQYYRDTLLAQMIPEMNELSNHGH